MRESSQLACASNCPASIAVIKFAVNPCLLQVHERHRPTRPDRPNKREHHPVRDIKGIDQHTLALFQVSREPGEHTRKFFIIWIHADESEGNAARGQAANIPVVVRPS